MSEQYLAWGRECRDTDDGPWDLIHVEVTNKQPPSEHDDAFRWVPYVRASDHDRLTRENRILQLKADSSLANNLCPDHRDKQTGKPCLACTIEKLESKNGRLTREVAELREVLHSINLRATLAEAGVIHMRGTLGNIKDESAEALAKVTP